MYINSEIYDKIVKSVPIACVDLLILHQNKCLLLKRNNDPAKDQFWFPGGRINKMEKIIDACLRIARSECNIDCKYVKQLCIEETLFLQEGNMLSDKHTINICCLLHVDDISKLRIDSYHSEYIWVDEITKSLHVSVARPLEIIGF